MALEGVVSGIKTGELLREWAALPRLQRARVHNMIVLLDLACEVLEGGRSLNAYRAEMNSLLELQAGRRLANDPGMQAARTKRERRAAAERLPHDDPLPIDIPSLHAEHTGAVDRLCSEITTLRAEHSFKLRRP